jgi:uncharacterized protein YecE (DUF72 family)
MTPDSLLFGLKVPEDITVPKWPRHARYGQRAGLDNEHFLDVNLFAKLFARPLERYAARVATLIFEFGTFAKSVFPRPEDFYTRLDAFLAALPPGFRYSVEIRNSEYLRPAYLDLLARHGVAHVLNAWTRMPTLDEQAMLPGVDAAGFSVVRALLPRGRTYEQAVQALSPYESIKEPCESARDGLRLVAESARKRQKPAFLFINNRLEGHAPTTIESVADHLLF